MNKKEEKRHEELTKFNFNGIKTYKEIEQEIYAIGFQTPGTIMSYRNKKRMESWRALAIALADICLLYLKHKYFEDRQVIKQIAECIKEFERNENE